MLKTQPLGGGGRILRLVQTIPTKEKPTRKALIGSSYDFCKLFFCNTWPKELLYSLTNPVRFANNAKRAEHKIDPRFLSRPFANFFCKNKD